MDSHSKLVQDLNHKIKILEQENEEGRVMIEDFLKPKDSNLQNKRHALGVWMLDNSYQTVFVTSGISDLLGYSDIEVVGKSIMDFLNEHDQILLAYQINKNPGNGYFLPIRVLNRNNQQYPFLIKVSRFILDNVHTGSLIELFPDEANTTEKAHDDKQGAILELFKFVHRIPIGCIITGNDFKIKFVNVLAEKTLNIASESALEKTIFEVFAPNHTHDFFKELNKRANIKQFFEKGDFNHVQKISNSLICEWFLFPFTSYGKDVCNVLIFNDVTEEEQNKKLLEIQKRTLELMASGAEQDEILEVLVQSLEEESEGALCSILLLDEKGEKLEFSAAPNLPEDYNRKISGHAIGPKNGSCGTAAFLRKMIVVEDIENDPLWADYKGLALQYGLKACTSVPIFGKDEKPLGTFAFYYKEKKAPSDYDLILIKASSALAGILIQRKRYVQTLKESEELFHLIMENINDTISLHTDQGKINYVNASIEDSLGYKPEEFLGYNVTRDVHPEDVKLVKESLESLKNDKPSEITYRARHKDTSWRWLETWSKRVKNKGENLILQVARDITDKIKTEQIQMQLTEELIRQNKELQQFSYITSHNLRAPLTNIMGLISIFNYDNPADEENIQILKNLQITVNNIDNIIKDLNQIVSSRNINENKREIYFKELLEVIENILNEQIKSSNAVIISDFDEAPSIYSVISYMQSIFTNLIENAIKYRSPNRNLFIEIKTFRSADSLIITIKDNGLGIDLKKYGDKIFGLYRRFHKHVGGKGLGLHLVKTQVETIGGTIKIESEIDKGTCYTLTFKNSYFDFPHD